MTAHQTFFNRFRNNLPCLFHQAFRFTYINKSTGYDIRSGKKLVGTLFQCQNDNQDSVFCQMLTITQNNITDIANTESIYQDFSCVYLIYNFCAFIIQCKYIA